ncbi:MAG: phytanoyl-CoA dioxygenase family protein [Actinobacteria bacterium]|nr:phytanoyl-CoA dioxygenase family protein [Actinomycetota bacterium]
MIDSLTPEQIDAFDRDGFLVVEEGLVPPAALELLRERFLRLFEGVYETGIKPDEVNWVPGRDPDDRTRQICNGWRADSVVAAQVLSERTGRLVAQLAGYRGTRILQDNVLWKPPGTKAIGFHQDSSYADYLVPPEMVTCWISLDDLPADAGPIEYVRGSHRWPKSPPHRSQFHAPDDWLAPARAASPDGPDAELDLVPVVVKAGGGSFHHGLTWHGSAPNVNATTSRMALVSHLLPVEARFHETNVDLVYSRYRRRGDLSLEESFFPVTWDVTGYRTPWLAELPELGYFPRKNSERTPEAGRGK